MAHALSEIFVHAEWREITQRIVRQDARLWAAMRIAVIGVAVAAQLLSRIAAPWSVALGVGLFCALFWGFPLWWLWRPAARSATRLNERTRSVTRTRAICAASAIAVGAAIVVALAERAGLWRTV